MHVVVAEGVRRGHQARLRPASAGGSHAGRRASEACRTPSPTACCRLEVRFPAASLVRTGGHRRVARRGAAAAAVKEAATVSGQPHGPHHHSLVRHAAGLEDL
eukprot:CAMPEP_0204013920 /NCGR_PEP_ID=MMETSP0360-20130528/25037_1 /ASSEMBLY_ACC=CAM_ASM_000342 /TAXON_ID=268821 /ORGANISM="Scrippsiella Hangoei, Strain SHTV-5" /LENGTH=102 /DNA_ID=CAMNT_0050956725 /DNA_START=123 /DNA_END=431 /DNA_ORIENTATION=+